jgi:uncharacterized membrane protein YdjX (TVP38/TMEM64 family)
MIQRVQTLWLALAATLSLLTLKFSIYSGNQLDDKGVKKWVELTAVNHFLILVFTIAVAVAALITIFLYKDRKSQMRISLAALILSIANIFLYVNQTNKFVEGNYDLSAILALAIPIILGLAIWGIYKDEKLIKSADRLR